MAETLLNQVSTDETLLDDLLEWLTLVNHTDEKFVRLSTKFKCTRTEFIGYFLNFVHEEIGNWNNEKTDLEETKSSNEINRSHSFPLDLSSEIENVSNSTPNVAKVNSDTSVLSYMSPISPIYKNSSFTTPKSKLCLGDFIINKKVSSKKKNSETKRRIKPTNLSQSKVSSFHKSENSFSFNKSELDECPIERNVLVEEKLRILSRNLTHCNVSGDSPLKTQNTKVGFSGEVQADPQLVTNSQQIDHVVRIYLGLLNNNFVLNLTNEIHFLIGLLLKKQHYGLDWGIAPLSDQTTIRDLFKTIHNVVYFACQTLTSQARVLRNYDNATIRLLLENCRVQIFAPMLVSELQKVTKPDRIVEIESVQVNICFNSDTDNRQNFPSDPTFHAFRKQRDLFYDILRLWESHRLSPGFDFGISLGGKIKSLLSLSHEATNFVHLARLFKGQLLTCRHGDDFFTSLEMDQQKLNKLKSRCVTKTNCQSSEFSEKEEFYKDFIVTGANYIFNRHLSDVLIEEIIELNESNFGSPLEEEDYLESVTKKSYYTFIKNLRILAKFLAFVECLPYKHDGFHYSENLLATHLKIRKQLNPNFDIKTLLENSIKRKSVILCVPWLIKYLSMLDFVTLKLPYYVQVQTTLFWIYHNFDWGPDPNVYLIKFSLGWLFDLPHLPVQDYLNFRNGGMDFDVASPAPKFCLDALDIVDQDILYFCCPFLDEIKKLLEATLTSRPISIKHITPVTALQSPDDVARRRLEQQLEEAFFNGQPISLRKTVEFVSERIASTCVKHICHTLVPAHKKLALEKLKSCIGLDEDADFETQKAAMRTKANRLAMTCLKDLQAACEDELKMISEPKIEKAIESLVSLDTLTQTKQVCVGITEKSCRERVRQWIDGHVIPSVFAKDFNDEIQRIINGECKRSKKPVFMLPSGGTNPKHNDKTISGAHLLDDYRYLSIKVIEKNVVSREAVTSLLDATAQSIDERGDFNQCILATICTQILDIVILLIAHDSRVLSDDVILSKACVIWRLYYNGCDDLFKSLLSPRNVTIFSRSLDPKATWHTFARFCAYLLKNDLLSCQIFESQCTGIFRTDRDQETLTLISYFFTTVGELYRRQGGCTADFTFLLDFFSDYCEDLF